MTTPKDQEELRAAEDWADVISPAAVIGAPGELERQIRRIQVNALRYASNITVKVSNEVYRGAHVNAGDVCGTIRRRITQTADKLEGK